jgi:hypothetical protein
VLLETDNTTQYWLLRSVKALFFFLNLFVSGKEHHNTNIGCNPFSGRLTHSTRQMREHKTVSSNYRRLSTSTIVFIEKIWFEKVFKLTGYLCVFFLEEEENDS